jgi:dCTP deaminase
VILRASHIATLLRDGRLPGTVDPLVITPTPNLETDQRRGAASVDLRLGTWFVSLRQARMTHLSVDKPGAPAQLTKNHYVPYGEGYILHPGGFVLGATIEWLRMTQGLAAYVIGKSSWGRRGLIIATATGVHPGFKGCLTLELSNVGQIPIELKPGIEICQLFFHAVQALGGNEVDQSQYVGRRRPVLGTIKMDDIAERLARAGANIGMT